MPYCEVGKYQSCGEAGAGAGGGSNEIKIFYRTYGHGPVKVLMIIGLAGTHDSWGPQIQGLVGTSVANDGDFPADGEVGNECGVQVCAFDNRGVGRSSVPTNKSEYTTRIMAKDAIALMDHMGWKKAHIFGHSMGAMIASKLAALVPDRILSLALLNVTGGGYECLPREYLEEYVGTEKRRAILYQEYVKGISASGMQSDYGFDGQINACWKHKMLPTEFDVIRSAGFLISVIHGRQDVIAQLYYARRLAEKLHPFARMVELHGGHLVSHERPEEVNQALLDLVTASEKGMNPLEWTNLPKKSPGWTVKRISNSGTVSNLYVNSMEKIKLFLSYLFGILILFLEYVRRAIRSLKPVRVGPART